MKPYPPKRRVAPWRRWLARGLAAVGITVFFYPACQLMLAIFDPALNGPGVPRLARQMHASLTPRYERWATERLQDKAAIQLSIADVSGTEWPLYGSVFYLRAEEALQAAWEYNHALFRQEPRTYARAAIDAAARLVADPGQAAWVKKYWGDSYLAKENVFYRMLLISALASHRHLTGSGEFLSLLRSQTDGLAAELAASPTGWLDDYPGQCYPTDIISAWEAIQRADRVLGTDHSAPINQALQNFTGERVGSLGLPPYYALAKSGRYADASRGCSNSNACMLAPALWPAIAPVWYANYERSFWQRDWLAAGFREFPPGPTSPQWHFDVDAGPVVRGNGFAACGFGVAAARRNGRFDHAYPLSLEMIALSWPLPGGRLVLPRLVSDSANAPLLGEAAILYTLVQPTADGFSPRYNRAFVPGVVWICLALYLTIGALLLRLAWQLTRPEFVPLPSLDAMLRRRREKFPKA